MNEHVESLNQIKTTAIDLFAGAGSEHHFVLAPRRGAKITRRPAVGVRGRQSEGFDQCFAETGVVAKPLREIVHGARPTDRVRKIGDVVFEAEIVFMNG